LNRLDDLVLGILDEKNFFRLLGTIVEEEVHGVFGQFRHNRIPK
jgi:hypothetical protein